MRTSNYPAYQDFKWAVRLHRFSLELVGLWPNSVQTTWERYICNLRTLLVFLTVSSIVIIPALHSLIRIHSDILLVTDNLQFTLPIITNMLKIVIFWWKKEAVAPIIDMIAKDWMKSKESQEKMTMIAKAQTARLIVAFGYCFMMLGWIVTVILPALGYSVRHLTNITDPGRPLPVQTYYIYDVTKSPQYEITFTFQAIAMFMCIIPYTGIDNFLSLLIFHISGQLDILNNRLMRLNDIANYNDNLKSCVMDHTRLLRSIAVVEDTFNAILLILFLYFGILFACYGFVIMSMFADGYQLSISYLAYIISVVMNTFGHMCLYCTVGEILAEQCDRIHYTVYCNKWYTLKSRHARNLIFLMAKTNKPFNLNIGKVFPLTMATFCNLLKTSAGYISVLLTTKNQSKVTLFHDKEAEASFWITCDMKTSKNAEYEDFEWAVKLNRYTLKLIGLWPEAEQTTWEKCMCNLRALIVFISLLIGILIPAVHALIRIRGDFMLMIDNLQFTLPVFTAILRLIIFWWKKKAMLSLMDMIADDWTKPKASSEKNIMITRAQTARTITIFMYSMMGICFCIAIVTPACGFSMRYLTNITDPGKPLPLQTYYIYDITKSPQYELTFISQAIFMTLGALSYTGIDNFLSLLIFHICGQLDILKNHLTHLDKFANYAKALKSCVMDHMRLIRAIAIVEDTFNLMLLALFLYFGTLFAFYGFLILSLLEDGNYLSISRLAYLVTMVINTFGHMCAYCAVGEILVSQCNRIHYAAYSNKWYTMHSKRARDIIFLMVRTSEPLYLSAGKIFPLTMATFCNLIKTSAGYISVLLTTRY
ncbi:uncharacterized protein [Anoplolepis gracilipes]|uniref:uncharacterized protein n=1 Tax=Anoplolepis gracilipes TaxID=354296 RepID=UPI003BA0875A